jgi:hypothetical protein
MEYFWETVGSSTTRNDARLDKLVHRYFAVQLQDIGDPPMTTVAATAGAYLRLLCSITEIEQEVETFDENKVKVRNAYNGYGLEPIVKYIFFDRFGATAEQIMMAIRYVDEGGQNKDYCSKAYAAAGTLYSEIEHFKNSLSTGALRNHVSTL